MSITVAKSAGFCFGVDRAVKMVYDLVAQGKKVCTLGEIIHNPQIVKELKEKGVRTVESPEEVNDDEILVIRSHGVASSVIESIENLGINYEDATCPYVRKIHKIVSEASDSGRTVIVAGDACHPEVKGILGSIKGESFAVENEDELAQLIHSNQELYHTPVTMVAQTTFNSTIWIKCQKTLKKVCTNAIVFDTICKATAMRQHAAAELSGQSDLMVVIGGRHSSNTAKLYDICVSICPDTILIESADELDKEKVAKAKKIGVTAGASTPSAIIKEVINTMSEIKNIVEGSEAVETVENASVATESEEVEKSIDEMTFEEALEASLSNLNADQKVKGIVLGVNAKEIQVDIGRKHSGIIPANEYSSDPNVDLEKEVKVGDVLDLIIMRTNDQEGMVTLSKRRFDAIAGWDHVVEAKDSGEILTGTVVEIIKGGVLAVTSGIRVFIPASHATLSRGESLDALKGKEVRFKIIEIGRGRRAVGSIRLVLREERKELENKFWESVEVGQTYKGTVKTLTNYGAFVDLGGADGMIHISELSWSRIKHPSEVLNVGDIVEVYVKDIDTEKKKISLGYKKAEDNPWEILKNKYSVGDVAKVQIVSLTAYGAFARIIPGVDGLIHISQIADHRIEKPQDVLKVGDEVDVKITEIDFDKKRVSLSIRALISETEEAAE